jgi:hypothetical protein
MEQDKTASRREDVGASVEELLDVSAAASKRVRDIERVLFSCVPQSAMAHSVYAALKLAEDVEREARRAVRAHPDHSYEGL